MLSAALRDAERVTAYEGGVRTKQALLGYTYFSSRIECSGAWLEPVIPLTSCWLCGRCWRVEETSGFLTATLLEGERQGSMAAKVFRKRNKAAGKGGGTIWVDSMVGGSDLEPWVNVHWNGESGKLTPAEARAHAAAVLQTANAAESDAFLVEVLQGRCGFETGAAVSVLQEFRAWRDAVKLPQRVRPDELRAEAMRLLAEAECLDAQRFLVEFLVKRVRVERDTAERVADHYAERFRQRSETGPPEGGVQ